VTADLHERVARLPTRLLELLLRWTHTDGELDRRMEMILPRDRSVPARLSFAQERLWFLDQFQPGSPAYNLPLVLPFGDPLDTSLLQRALAHVVARHESLRTTFAVVGGSPVQRVAVDADAGVEIKEIDLRERPDAYAEAERVLREEVMRPFDLRRGPVLRALLIRRAEGNSLLVANMHHIVSDGWSCGVFTRELTTLYNAFAQDRPSPLHGLPIQYADFAAWQREWLQGETLAHHVAYWKEQLAGAPALLDLPSERPRPIVESHRGAFQAIVVPAHLVRPLREVSRERGATLFMVALAGFVALLSRYSGMKDIVIGSPIANRNRHELEGLIGFFVNMLALRIEVPDDLSLRALVDRVREVTLGGYEHQDLPFEKLVEELRPRRSLAHSPVYQVALVLQNTPDAAVPGIVGEPEELGWHDEPPVVRGSAKFDITLSFAERGDGLVGTCEYRTDLFGHRTIARFLRRYLRVLDVIARKPEMTVSELPMHLPDEPQVRRMLSGRDPRAGDRAAASLLGLAADSRLAVLDDDAELLAFGCAACDAAGATLDARVGDQPIGCGVTHVLASARQLAALGNDALPRSAVVAIAGLPCFDVVWSRWADRRVVGFWGIPGAPCCAALTLNAPEAMIGAPVEGCWLEILDQQLRRQATDLWGELYVGGPIVPPPSSGDGSWIADPFAPVGHLYRSGLRARGRDDGCIELGGLAARTVTIEGMKVDPSRLEALLVQHPAVDAAAVRMQGQGSEACLVAYIVPRAGRRLDEDELTRYVAERLPAGLVPRRVVIVKQLPAGDIAAQPVRSIESPSTPAEAVIARIWTDVLKRPAIDVNANFFDHGGNSLSSVQVISRIRDMLQVELPLHRLFEAPTIAELAQVVEASPAFVAAEPERISGHELEPALRRTFSMLEIDTDDLTQEEILDLVHTLEDWEVDELLEQLLRHQA